MEIQNDRYWLVYDVESNTLRISGRIRDTDPEVFRAMTELLEQAAAINRLSMIWDIRELEDMNSAGVGVLYHFVASRRDNPDYVLRIMADDSWPWQGRALSNLKRLMPRMQLEFHRAPKSA